MVKGRLPDEGPVRLGPVTLPAGRLVMGNQPREPVAWATIDPLPGWDQVWVALSELHPQTGLVPILLDGLRVDSMFHRDRQGCPPMRCVRGITGNSTGRRIRVRRTGSMSAPC
jgi:hypothetical protein